MLRNIVLGALVATAIGGAAVSAAEPKVAQRWAVLIGIDQYAFKQPRKYCGTDQQALRDRLVAAGFPADQVFLLHDKATEAKLKPTKENIERQISAVLQSAAAADLVVIAFSGQGVNLAGKSYWCPGDGSLDDVATLISVDGLNDRLKTAAKVKLVFADAGRTDPRSDGKRPTTSPLGTRTLARSLAEQKFPEGVVLMNSCAPGEDSQEDAKLGCSVFMHYLLDGLGSAADANADGAVSVFELQGHVSSRTKKHVYATFGVSQRPFFKGELSTTALEFPLIPVKAKP